MKLGFRQRRLLSVLVLLVFLPIYIGLVVVLLAQMPRLPILIEVVIYVVMGFLWAIPFRAVFRGIGRPDPNKEPPRFLDDAANARDRAKSREMP